MRSGKWWYTGMVLLTMMAPVQQSLAATATVTVNATFIDPSCTVTIPKSEILLGTLKLGSTSHTAAEIEITCPVDREFGLYATVKEGVVLAGNRKMTMVHNAGTATTPVEFWLTAKDATDGIDLSGNGRTDVALRFCKGTTKGTHKCPVTPYTRMQSGTHPGQVSAGVAFTMAYP